MERIAKPKARGNGEGEPYPIREDGKTVGYAFIIYYTVDGVRRSKKIERRITKNRSPAQARSLVRNEVNDLRKRIACDEDINAKPQTVEVFLDEWIEFVSKKGRTAKTIDTYEWAKSKVTPHIGKVSVAKLSTRRLDELFIELGEGDNPLSSGSIGQVRKMLRTAFKQAKKWKLRTDNPVLDTDPIPAPASIGKRLTKEESLAIVALVRIKRLGLAVILALLFGLRRGEIAAIRWPDIDFERRTLTVHKSISYTKKRGKQYKSLKTGEKGIRVIPLSPALFQVFVDHRARLEAEREAMGTRWQPDMGFVFVAARKGGMLNPNVIYALWKQMCKEVGISGYRLQDARHSVVSDLSEQGIEDVTISAFVGHSSPLITQKVYNHSSPKQIANATAHREFLLEVPVRTQQSEGGE